VRAFAKPMLEVLAGIPTIVYGLFALLTVGPLLMTVFGDEGIGIMQAGTAVMTAGLVMGIMLIPFVSSLSDDIINAVPQAMRDGSYGLGATQSETIRQVVLPAALPGIVGAILLAASRAIGETMIVVLGAGAAARLSLNPFDAMTTVTAKIVSSSQATRFRLARGAGGLCPWHDALRHHAGAQHFRALHRAQVPGAV
jgi:phosphate transport system permease protein